MHWLNGFNVTEPPLEKARHTDRNCGQCWACKNQIGELSVNKGRYIVLLPEGRVTECYMTYVNYGHCPYYEDKE